MLIDCLYLGYGSGQKKEEEEWLKRRAFAKFHERAPTKKGQ
jgi:hypothetical protein